MAVACPQCGAPDECVPVPQALADVRLDGGVRALLAPPPQPEPVRVRMHTASIVLFSVAGFFLLSGLVSLLNSTASLDDGNVAYRAGRIVGVFLLPGILTAIGLVVHVKARAKRTWAAEQGLPERQAMWQRHMRVWQAGWLCRRCWVAFFPAGSVRPDAPASAAIPLAHFPSWVMAGVGPVSVPGWPQG
ncbi:hypothetical protein PUR71_00710 [Streptomyces sp. SP17BM10]|uniref:hypothetical protein n=1 Tax=Streptomyces sp. SP17BM10 TaxID=3002530 RepID=UPI002E7A81B9|nr:hypothetical protein [Streptomyces sp. SP17BM10]MEE1781469.1 hypothetical protein [Streptomyces sp. SP17BM10]